MGDYMGNASFLVGPTGGGTYINLFEAIDRLREFSDVFILRFQRGDLQGAAKISEKAFECFDYIVGQFMRIRDERTQSNTYTNTPFEASMTTVSALHLIPFTATQRSDLLAIGPGNGRFPVGFTPAPIDLSKTLNKIKHRHPTIMNFRIDNGRHVFLMYASGIGRSHAATA